MASKIADGVRLARALQVYAQKNLQKTSIFTNKVDELLRASGIRAGSFDARFPVLYSFHGLDVKETLGQAYKDKDISKIAHDYALQGAYNAIKVIAGRYPVLDAQTWSKIETALAEFSNTALEADSLQGTNPKYLKELNAEILKNMKAKFDNLKAVFNKAYLVSYIDQDPEAGMEPSVKILHNSFSNFRDSINRIIKKEISDILELNRVHNSKLSDPNYLTTKILNWGHTRTGDSIISGKIIASLMSFKNAAISNEAMEIVVKDFIRETGQTNTNIKLHKGDLTKGSSEVLSFVISSSYIQKVIAQNRLYNQAVLGQQEAKWNIVEAIERNPELKQLLGVSSRDQLLDMFLEIKSSPSALDRVHASVAGIFDKKLFTAKGAATTQLLNVKNSIKQAIKQIKVIPKSKKISSSTKKAPIQDRGSEVNLLAILQAAINQKVAENMGSGNERRILNYRTGRFAESVKVERISESRQGMISAFYSYMKNPYATFSEGGRQQSPKTRDPKLLISKSIREIAAPIVGNRLRSVVV